jgi:hypothetical protein
LVRYTEGPKGRRCHFTVASDGSRTNLKAGKGAQRSRADNRRGQTGLVYKPGMVPPTTRPTSRDQMETMVITVTIQYFFSWTKDIDNPRESNPVTRGSVHCQQMIEIKKFRIMPIFV